MDEGTTVTPTAPMPVMCECKCPECVSGSCATCSHMSTEEGCNCAGCTCNDMAPEQPMSM